MRRLFSVLHALLVPLLALPLLAQQPAPAVEPSTVADDGVRVAVLGYHDFSETQPETEMRMKPSKFRKQMETIRRLGLHPITLDDFIAWKRGEKKLPAKCVLITLDDGWKAVYTDAYPVLKEFNFPFTLFLYKQYVDGGGKALTSEMVKEMQAHGASIGCHSATHPFPSEVKANAKKGADHFASFLNIQMAESKRFLEEKFGGKVTTYAYPGGYHTPEMLELADQLGYTHLFTVVPGKVKRSSPDKTLPRYMIFGSLDRIFDAAMQFNETNATVSEAGGGDLVQTTPVPVTPVAGAILNTRLPVISADLATIPGEIDPATISMKVSGFGEVPAKFDPATKKLSWTVNRRLRNPTCQVVVAWKLKDAKQPSEPVRWSFQIDREAAYLPEEESTKP